jgi:hypothetical protein
VAGGISNVVIRIAAETAGAVADIGKVNKALGEQMTQGQKASAGLKKAAVPAAAAFAVAGAAIMDFTKAAAEDADAQAHLASSMRKTVGATEDQIKASESYIDSLSSATGIADDEMRPALEKLAAASGSAAKGQKDLALAVDIAEAAHVDLATATKAVAGAEQGRLGALNKLVPGIDAATIKSKDSTKALEEASKLTGGAATEAAKTYGGQLKIMSLQVEEAKESIGAAFLPVLKMLLPVLKTVTNFVSENTTAFTVLLGAVAAVSGTILVANGVMKAYQAAAILVKVATVAWTGVQYLLNLALAANPIGLIVLAIVGAAGLLFALKKAYDSCEAFREVIDTLWGAIKTGVALYLKPLVLTIDAVRAAFNLAKAAFESGFASEWAGRIVTALQPLLEVLRGVARVLTRIARVSFEALIAGIKTLIEWLGKIHIPKVPDWVPGIGRSTFGTVAASSSAGRSSSVRAVGPGGVTINVFGALDAEGTARQVRRLLAAHDRRQGRIA